MLNPAMTVSRNTRARRARLLTPSGVGGRGTSGAKMFSQHSGHLQAAGRRPDRAADGRFRRNPACSPDPAASCDGP